MDPELKPDIVAITAVSAALMLLGIPFDGPVSGVRIGQVDEKLIAFPTAEEIKTSQLDLIVAGTKEAIMMVEAGAHEVSEDTMVEAIELAHKSFQTAIDLQNELVKKVGVVEQEFELLLPSEDIQKEVDKYLDGKLGKNIRGNQMERTDKMRELRHETLEHFKEKAGEEFDREAYYDAFESALKKDVRKGILVDGIRPDGRKTTEIRPLSSEVGILPRTHGSSIFTRGSTQALNITTLAPLNYAQLLGNQWAPLVDDITLLAPRGVRRPCASRPG